MSKKNGPSGGILNNAYSYDTNPDATDDIAQLSEITVWAGSRIDGFDIVWLNRGGGTGSDHCGGFGGTTNHPWLIRQGEHVVRIEGSLDGKEDKLSLRVYTIQFFTEKSSSPLYPIGKKSKDHKFYFECPDGAQITGFFGWADEELDSVGVHMAPI